MCARNKVTSGRHQGQVDEPNCMNYANQLGSKDRRSEKMDEVYRWWESLIGDGGRKLVHLVSGVPMEQPSATVR